MIASRSGSWGRPIRPWRIAKSMITKLTLAGVRGLLIPDNRQKEKSSLIRKSYERRDYVIGNCAVSPTPEITPNTTEETPRKPGGASDSVWKRALLILMAIFLAAYSFIVFDLQNLTSMLYAVILGLVAVYCVVIAINPPKPPKNFAVILIDDEIRNETPKGKIERIRVTDVSRVLVITNDSGPWGEDVWFVLEDKSGKSLAFPLGATGYELVLDRLQLLPGFELQGMNSTQNAQFECWPNPTKSST